MISLRFGCRILAGTPRWTATGLLAAFLVSAEGVALAGEAGAGDRIGRHVERVLDDPSFHRSFWGVQIQSADTGEILYRRNAEKYFVPASNLKLLTAVAALERLGMGFHFETEVAVDGPVRDGVLQGSLLIRGGGDPTLGARPQSPDPEDLERGDPLAPFRDWAARLRAAGIRRIEGDLIGDDTLFDSVRHGRGWSWDSLAYGYAAGVSGLLFNENVVLLRLSPGETPGDPARVERVPESSYPEIRSLLTTVPAGEETDFRVERGSRGEVVLRGVLAEEQPPLRQTVSSGDPTLFFLTVLRETLEAEGIPVDGRLLSRRDLAEDEWRPGRTLFTHRSPELSYVLGVLLKVSQNLYGETLLRMLDPRPRKKSAEGGLREVERVLTRMGVSADSYRMVDGSGLSRLNLVSPDALCRLLLAAHRSGWGSDFPDLLPVAGRDGTLRGRFRRSPAENNARAKTGLLSGARTLSGYVTSADGETLIFVVMVNHFDQPFRSAEFLQDLIVDYLAAFNR